jgi:hypothetical protein
MLSMLGVVMLSAVVLNVVVLSKQAVDEEKSLGRKLFIIKLSSRVICTLSR